MYTAYTIRIIVLHTDGPWPENFHVSRYVTNARVHHLAPAIAMVVSLNTSLVPLRARRTTPHGPMRHGTDFVYDMKR